MKKAVVEDGVDLIGYTRGAALTWFLPEQGKSKKRYGMIYVNKATKGRERWNGYVKRRFLVSDFIANNGENI
ncbi:hypothetical protein ACVXG8_26910 [Escherichia coli]